MKNLKECVQRYGGKYGKIKDIGMRNITLPNGYVITTRLKGTPQEYYTAKYGDSVFTSKDKNYIISKAGGQMGNKNEK